MEITNIGTQLKLAVRLNCARLTQDDFDFTCHFYTFRDKFTDVDKSEMVKGDGCYIATLDTRWLSEGELMVRVAAKIPDSDYEGGTRVEIATYRTGITLKR